MLTPRQQLTAFRAWAYNISPAFGAQIDALIAKGAGFGDDDLSSILSSIDAGLENAANTVQLSLTDYYNAKTALAHMQEANAAGLTVDQYNATALQRNTLSNLISGTKTPSIGGIPIWMLLVGGGAFILLNKKHRRR